MTEIDIKSPEDILEYMKENIRYGWLDINNEEHIGNLKDVRRLYRTASIEETLEHKLGTCIEQVNLMHYLLDILGIPNKMFCTRVYEKDDFNDLDAEEHMHCFVLYYQDGKVHQIEHPNWERIGTYHFDSEEEAIKKINTIYEEMADGISRPVTEYPNVIPHQTFKEFNAYINSLDNSKQK